MKGQAEQNEELPVVRARTLPGQDEGGHGDDDRVPEHRGVPRRIAGSDERLAGPSPAPLFVRLERLRLFLVPSTYAFQRCVPRPWLH